MSFGLILTAETLSTLTNSWYKKPIPFDSNSAIKSDLIKLFELGKFDKKLLDKQEIVVLSKTDTISEKEIKLKMSALKKASKAKEVYSLSLYEDDSIKNFGDTLIKLLASNK